MTDPNPDDCRPAIYVDADACPVKDEVYRVAERYDVPVRVVSNRYIQTPNRALIQLVVVGQGFDEADDWIAERADPASIVVTADIPLAQRCLQGGARVLGPKGSPFTHESIGAALAQRELSDQLRQMGLQTGGPKPFQKADRSRFLQTLDQMVNAVLRETKRREAQ